MEFVSDGCHALTGYRAVDLTGNRVVAYGDRVHPEDRDFVDGRWKAALRGEAYNVEHRILKDGRVGWVRERAELEFDPQGNLLGGFGTTQDVTDLKIAEKALRESEQRFQLASEIGRSGTWDWDVGSGAVVWSRGHFEILGYRLGEVQPSYAAWAERVHPDDRAGVEAEIRRTMAEHAEYPREFRALWPEGSIHGMSAHPRYEYGEDGACRRMVGVMADVTEIKEAEHRLRELNAELSVLLAERTRLADERAATCAHWRLNSFTPSSASATGCTKCFRTTFSRCWWVPDCV